MKFELKLLCDEFENSKMFNIIALALVLRNMALQYRSLWC